MNVLIDTQILMWYQLFDRLLLATAFSENIPIISSDENFRFYKQQVQVFNNS